MTNSKVETITPANRLNYCHICGDSEIDWDLEACFACNKWTCPECCGEIESDDGDPLGVLCAECDEKSKA